MVELPSFPRLHIFPSLQWSPVLAIATVFLTIASGAMAQQRFRTPDEAVAALINAAQAGSPALLIRVLGPGR
jgi:hypothetical protein